MPELWFRALLMDLDGTIADTHHLIHQCISYTLERQIGRGLERWEWEQWVGVPLKGLFPAAYAHYGIPAPDENTMAELTACYRQRLEQVDSDVQPFPGVIGVIEDMRSAGMRLAIVTTKHGRAAERTLKNIGLAERMDAVVAGEDCANHKPHPEPFLRACELLKVEPAQCAALGDSTADILGAKAAGVHAIAALWGVAGVEAVMAAGPDSVAHRPDDLLTILGVGAPT